MDSRISRKISSLRKLNEYWQIFSRSRRGVIGLGILTFFIAISFLAPLIAPYDPYSRVDQPLLSPSKKHLLGTNDIGQDLLSELIYGTRISLMIGFLVAFSTAFIGTLVGLITGYYGGITDEILMRICDIVLVLPNISLMILFAALFGRQSFIVIILILTITAWPSYARLVRSATLSLKQRTFVEVTKGLGASDLHIMFKHILPNLGPILLASMTFRVSGAMLAEASLSFLGLGDPTKKSWGMMLHFANSRGGWWANNGKPAYWWIIPPGLCIAMTTLFLNMIGQALEEIMDPRLRGRR